MALQSSGEMYIETIYTLSQQKATVRSIDVAESMGFSKPSVSRAVSQLKKENYITVDENGYITLTEGGLQLAQKIYERHVVLSNVLIRLGVSEETALQDACRIEHVISDETFEALKKHSESR
jgi:Mn-dependent DtxR family transcriptional regulator